MWPGLTAWHAQGRPRAVSPQCVPASHPRLLCWPVFVPPWLISASRVVSVRHSSKCFVASQTSMSGLKLRYDMRPATSGSKSAMLGSTSTSYRLHAGITTEHAFKWQPIHINLTKHKCTKRTLSRPWTTRAPSVSPQGPAALLPWMDRRKIVSPRARHQAYRALAAAARRCMNFMLLMLLDSLRSEAPAMACLSRGVRTMTSMVVWMWCHVAGMSRIRNQTGHELPRLCKLPMYVCGTTFLRWR